MADLPPPPGEWGPTRSPGRRGPSGPRAGFGVRLLGLMIDNLILLGVDAIIQSLVGDVAGLAIGLAFGFWYAVSLIGGPRGQTLGMRAVGIRAIDLETRSRVDFGRAVVRYLVAIVSGLACFLGYLWMIWDPERQTWHDRAAGTVVVPVAAFPVPAGR